MSSRVPISNDVFSMHHNITVHNLRVDSITQSLLESVAKRRKQELQLTLPNPFVLPHDLIPSLTTEIQACRLFQRGQVFFHNARSGKRREQRSGRLGVPAGTVSAAAMDTPAHDLLVFVSSKLSFLVWPLEEPAHQLNVPRSL